MFKMVHRNITPFGLNIGIGAVLGLLFGLMLDHLFIGVSLGFGFGLVWDLIKSK